MFLIFFHFFKKHNVLFLSCLIFLTKKQRYSHQLINKF